LKYRNIRKIRIIKTFEREKLNIEKLKTPDYGGVEKCEFILKLIIRV